jgi:hypothetical protein
VHLILPERRSPTRQQSVALNERVSAEVIYVPDEPPRVMRLQNQSGKIRMTGKWFSLVPGEVERNITGFATNRDESFRVPR